MSYNFTNGVFPCATFGSPTFGYARIFLHFDPFLLGFVRREAAVVELHGSVDVSATLVREASVGVQIRCVRGV